MIELPYPAPALWPNFRSKTHWAKTRAIKNARSDGYYAARKAKVGFVAGDVPIRLAITIHPLDPRPQCQPDKDNALAALKAYLDGIADYLKVNDRFFEPQTPMIGEAVKGGAVTVEVL